MQTGDKSLKPRKILITGGGTGGHVFPALALAEEFARRGFTVHYAGSDKGMEAVPVPKKGIPFHTVRSGAVKNQGLLKIASTLFRLFSGILGAAWLLLRIRPNAVLGVGGYVSVPVICAAFLLRFPIYLQEQNTSVGIANRFLGRFAKRIFLGFDEARACFQPSKCIHSGNPIRKEFFLEPVPSYNPTGLFILVIGGSQGAKAINDVMIELLADIVAKFGSVSIVHQTGKKDVDTVSEKYSHISGARTKVLPFIENMPEAYGKASLVIARSGALTVAELIQVERPALLVPYPRKGQNDQTANAALLEKHGVARVVEQGERFKERFWEAFSELFQPEQLRKMHQSFSRLQKLDALATIGDLVESDLRTDVQKH